MFLSRDLAECPLQFLAQGIVSAHDRGDGEVLFHYQRNGKEIVAELHDIIGGASADGLGGNVADVFAGDEDHGRGAAAADFVEKGEALAVGEVVVGQ